MIHRHLLAASSLILALALAGCQGDPIRSLSDDAVRAKVEEALMANPAARQEIVDRLTGSPATRPAVLEAILKDQTAAADLVKRILSDDRGKALVVSQVTADDAGARTFIRMLMLTGVMGTSITQKQADALGLGDAYTYGNRRRTMTDLKRLGRVVDAWSGTHGGRYPICGDLADVHSCLARSLPADRTASLRLRDAWGTPFQYRSDRDGSGYVLLSFATDAVWDGLGKVGPTDSLDCDIVFSNGDFVQWPGSILRKDIP